MSYTQTHTQSSSLIIFFSNLLSSLEKRESSRNSKDSSPFRLSSVLTNHHSFNAAERFEDRRRSTNTRQSTGPKIVDTKTTPINSSSDKTHICIHTHKQTHTPSLRTFRSTPGDTGYPRKRSIAAPIRISPAHRKRERKKRKIRENTAL
jgi:hypothetical protein